ncbi:hypothetical protein E2562_009543 [Oryza meyeriana var. granulata]|uniref:Uncharacterized protein n=1 Tax=Oryza meyeriana var. granulata TaxID=110450 RepID=A0A6G1F5T5_9ORYZ|nr:hypothetical protein E2562_009543 [Oryza meyeriana var. granulata]
MEAGVTTSQRPDLGLHQVLGMGAWGLGAEKVDGYSKWPTDKVLQLGAAPTDEAFDRCQQTIGWELQSGVAVWSSLPP